MLIVFWLWFYLSWSDKNTKTSGIFNNNVDAINITWYIWWEKKHFLEDEKVKSILKDKYGIEVKFDVKWSVSMIDNITWKDFIFPSSKTVWELMKTRNIPFLKRETIFYSPIVAYSWKDIVWVLEKEKLITITWTWNNIIKTLDLSWFTNLILANKNWEDIWWDKNYSNIKISSTNPIESNSWNMFASLLFKLFDWDLDKVKKIFDSMWLMNWSSWSMFKDFLQMQAWMYQIIIWYENQIIEYFYQNENYKNFIKENVEVVYLNPTIFADHEVISLTEEGNNLIIALQDKEILDIAWEKYGFRNILSNRKQDVIPGITQNNVKNVIPISSIQDIEKILEHLK